jgi:hypothetical protein
LKLNGGFTSPVYDKGMIYKADSWNRSRDYVCRTCGHIGRPSVQTKGSRKMEIFLWSVLMLPGPFYSFWRWASRFLACPKCKGTNIVPLDSPLGQRLFEEAMHETKKWGVF